MEKLWNIMDKMVRKIFKYGLKSFQRRMSIICSESRKIWFRINTFVMCEQLCQWVIENNMKT